MLLPIEIGASIPELTLSPAQIRRLLLHVHEIMHGGNRIPRVTPDTSLRDSLLEMTRKGLGMTAVVDADTFDTLSVKQVIIRAVGYIVSALPYYLGFVWIAFDKRKQGLHDKLAGSVVLHVIDDDSQISTEEWLQRFSHEFPG